MSSVYTKNLLVLTSIAVLCVVGCDNLKSKAAARNPAPTQASSTAQSPATVTPTASAASADQKLPKDVLAAVGDWTLTVAELDERIKNIKQVVPSFDEKNIQSRNMLIDELIRQQLMVYEARNLRLNETKEFKAAIKDFENNILVQQLVGDLTKDVKVAEEEARDFYEKNPNMFIKPVQKKLSEIVVPTEAEAKEILVSLLQGADFAETAKSRSKGKTAGNGGALGVLEKPTFAQMGKAIEGINKGNLSAVFQGPDGYYIVRVDDITGGDKVSFDEIKADLMKGLTSQKQQKIVLDKMAEVAKKVQVKVNTDLINVKTGE